MLCNSGLSLKRQNLTNEYWQKENRQLDYSKMSVKDWSWVRINPSLHLSLCLLVSVSVSICFCLCLSLYFCLSDSFSFSLYICTYIYLFIYLHIYINITYLCRTGTKDFFFLSKCVPVITIEKLMPLPLWIRQTQNHSFLMVLYFV